jgi:tRNA threonylcarbamoyladenosine biosynthesis protein TsaB
MPAVIGFDTATDDTAVAAMRDGELLFSSCVEPGPDGRPTHARRLLAEVARAAEAAGGWGSVQRIATGIGPGSFTGLRIGIATAKALAQSSGAELAGVTTLEALAREAAAGAGGRPVLATLDARRGELFAALYGGGGEAIWKPLVAPPQQLAEQLGRLDATPLAVGSGALRFRKELQRGGAKIPGDSDHLHRIAASQICAIGMGAAAADPKELKPIYLRAPDAERWRERDRT